ncbi:MAG: rane protein [Nocardioidaceae bacterium]|nr:rane protein [Nocardioidaceae bacterium]
MSRSRDVTLLAAMLGGSGVIHLVRPATFEPMMPEIVPAHREVILGSGVLELVAAAGLLSTRYRRPAGWLAAAILVGVYPANLKMAADAAKTHSTGVKVAAFGRLPLQLPLIRTALRAARN